MLEADVRILRSDEVNAAKRDAYADFHLRLYGSGLTVTTEASKRWWGIDKIDLYNKDTKP